MGSGGTRPWGDERMTHPITAWPTNPSAERAYAPPDTGMSKRIQRCPLWATKVAAVIRAQNEHLRHPFVFNGEGGQERQANPSDIPSAQRTIPQPTGQS